MDIEELDRIGIDDVSTLSLSWRIEELESAYGSIDESGNTSVLRSKSRSAWDVIEALDLKLNDLEKHVNEDLALLSIGSECQAFDVSENCWRDAKVLEHVGRTFTVAFNGSDSRRQVVLTLHQCLRA